MARRRVLKTVSRSSVFPACGAVSASNDSGRRLFRGITRVAGCGIRIPQRAGPSRSRRKHCGANRRVHEKGCAGLRQAAESLMAPRRV